MAEEYFIEAGTQTEPVKIELSAAKKKKAQFDGNSSAPMFFQRGDQSYKTMNFSTRLRGDKRKQSDVYDTQRLSR